MKKGKQYSVISGETEMEAEALIEKLLKDCAEGVEPESKSNTAERICLCQRIERLSREVEHYRDMAVERCMKDDLAAIREIDPKVERLENLGAEYLELIRAGVAAPVAYHAVNAVRMGKNPPSMGDVRAASDCDDIPFTHAQAIAMTPAQIAGNYDKLRRSMRNWK